MYPGQPARKTLFTAIEAANALTKFPDDQELEVKVRVAKLLVRYLGSTSFMQGCLPKSSDRRKWQTGSVRSRSSRLLQRIWKRLCSGKAISRATEEVVSCNPLF